MRVGGASASQAARAGAHAGDPVHARAQADGTAPGRRLDVGGVHRPDRAVLELDLDADAPHLDRQAGDDRAQTDAHRLVERLHGADEDVAVLGDDHAVADGDRERAAGALEAGRPGHGRRVGVPAHAEPVGVHRGLRHPVVERRSVVARREGCVRLGAERVQVVAHEVAGQIDGAHALGLGIALLGRGGVGMRVAGRVAVGRGEHRRVDRTVDGKAEQAERLTERGGHERTFPESDFLVCTPSAYGVYLVLTLRRAHRPRRSILYTPPSLSPGRAFGVLV